MAFASYSPGPDRRRFVSLMLTIAAHLVLLLLLLTLTPKTPKPVVRMPTSFTLLPSTDTSATAPKAERAVAKPQQQRAASRPAADRRTQPTPLPPEPVKTPPPPVLLGGHDLFAAADLSKMHGTADDAADDGGSAAGDSAAVYGPGEGPGGQRLYYAEWYREPTDAELGYWLPKEVPAGSWGMIACQTVPKYHVENCRSIGESPLGSGLGRALRQAAWQFLVRPPRVGGKALIGAWVRIRIDFTEAGAKVRRR